MVNIEVVGPDGEVLDAPARVFHDHTVTLTDRWTFRVTGPLFSEPLDLRSLGDAEEAIRGAERGAALQKKAEALVSVSVLDEQGRPCVVRGVHSGHGSLTGAPKDANFVYPQVPFVREALQKAAGLRGELNQLGELVRPFAVRTKRAYGRIRPEEYEKVVADFQREFERKEQAAKGRQEQRVRAGNVRDAATK